MTDSSINGAGHPGKKRLKGREVAAWSGKASLLTKLCIAVAWWTGEFDVDDLTVTQIARVLGVKAKQIRAVAQLSPEQRAALTTKRRLNGVGRFSNEMIEDFVVQVGANRLWAAIDRTTAPQTNGAATR